MEFSRDFLPPFDAPLVFGATCSNGTPSDLQPLTMDQVEQTLRHFDDILETVLRERLPNSVIEGLGIETCKALLFAQPDGTDPMGNKIYVSKRTKRHDLFLISDRQIIHLDLSEPEGIQSFRISTRDTRRPTHEEL